MGNSWVRRRVARTSLLGDAARRAILEAHLINDADISIAKATGDSEFAYVRIEDLNPDERDALLSELARGRDEMLEGDGIAVMDIDWTKIDEQEGDDVNRNPAGTSYAIPRLAVQLWLDAQPAARPPTPALAERVLCLLYPADRLDEVLGDMEEMFAKLAGRHGARFARLWYAWQVAGHAIGRISAALARASEVIGLKLT